MWSMAEGRSKSVPKSSSSLIPCSKLKNSIVVETGGLMGGSWVDWSWDGVDSGLGLGDGFDVECFSADGES